MIHCSSARLASRSSPIVRRATLTTVPSSRVIPGPSVAAAITARPDDVPIRMADVFESGTCPTVFFREVTGPRTTEHRLVEHVARIGEEHPPIDLGTVDFTVRNPRLLAKRYGHVLDYMARVELEVDRNVLELIAMLPDPPPVDRVFYADVWQPQEIRHGQILDELQVRLGRERGRRPTSTTSRRRSGCSARSRTSTGSRTSPGCSTT